MLAAVYYQQSMHTKSIGQAAIKDLSSYAVIGDDQRINPLPTITSSLKKQKPCTKV